VRVIPLAYLCFLALNAYGQTPQQTAGRGSFDELIVSADRPLGVLRDELVLGEDLFYSALNIILDNPDFRIECRYAENLGSNISTRICEPGFLAREEQFGMQRSIAIHRSTSSNVDPGTLAASANSSAQVAKLQAELRERMAAAVNEHPELRILFANYRARQAALERAEAQPRRRN
jgi:hypothetical protein